MSIMLKNIKLSTVASFDKQLLARTAVRPTGKLAGVTLLLNVLVLAGDFAS